ncbi:uncharacterized protein RSE6_01577 [Rhynchosporium secalis]|uniref:Uncharacterized protein n=1 Tax=Rhynchosporium secalis TaxID=38038 RepID=A0A1E1LY66_RHYSE|nr:uncharacterized protein RSE6_01577 [Rhynchosporium secalis]
MDTVKYAPDGSRRCTGNQLTLSSRNVLPRQQNDAFNEETAMTPTIETPRAGKLIDDRAEEVIDDLLAVPGVDGNLNGSNDLCTDPGILGQYDYTLYQDARPCL